MAEPSLADLQEKRRQLRYHVEQWISAEGGVHASDQAYDDLAGVVTELYRGRSFYKVERYVRKQLAQTWPGANRKSAHLLAERIWDWYWSAPVEGSVRPDDFQQELDWRFIAWLAALTFIVIAAVVADALGAARVWLAIVLLPIASLAALALVTGRGAFLRRLPLRDHPHPWRARARLPETWLFALATIVLTTYFIGTFIEGR